MQKASILFFSLTLMIIILTVTLIMASLFYIQTETIVKAGEGNTAFSAAQSGVERTRNSFAGKLSATACNGARQNGTITGSFVTYGPAADTTYSVAYWFICVGDVAPFTLHSYEITSTGSFGGARRVSVARGSWRQYISRWNMNENPAIHNTRILDTTNLNHGTLTTNDGTMNKSVDSVLTFDGVNDWVGLLEPPAVSTNISVGSIFAWIRTTGAGTGFRGIVVKQFAYGMFLQDNIFVIRDWSGAGATRSSLTNVADGTWRHVGFTFQSGVANGTILYINGVQVGAPTIMTINHQLEGIVFGAGNNPGTGEFFSGLLDEARIYNRVLTPEEVFATFNRGR